MFSRLAPIGGGLAASLAVGRRSTAAQPLQLVASGAGVNVKLMPSPDGEAMVPLRESFAFDALYAQCIIEDNPAAFAMETFAIGRVVIEPHQFFMAMYAHDMALTRIRRGEGNKRIATLAGELNCATYAGTASVSVGSRTATESAFFEIEAVDGGNGGGAAGDSFAFTVFFDRIVAPLNHAIFGPSPTFTEEMVDGEITIAPPVLRPLQD